MKENKLVMNIHCAKRFVPIKEAIEQLIKDTEKTELLIAIDGKAASGKTTLSYYLKELYDCNLFHMDDFFLQGSQRTEERLAEVGGNVDYERFMEEVIKPVLEKKEVIYRPFDCSAMELNPGFLIPYKPINIMEGSYSMHPYFHNPYDLGIFMDISDEDQLENIRKRNGEKMLVRFRDEWIPKENAYFHKFDIRNGCITIHWEEM
jgi:uridine kinase